MTTDEHKVEVREALADVLMSDGLREKPGMGRDYALNEADAILARFNVTERDGEGVSISRQRPMSENSVSLDSALKALAEETQERLRTGFNPGGRQVYGPDDDRRMRGLVAGVLALLARVEEAEERIAVTLEWLEENRPLRCGYASPDDYDDSASLIRMLTKGAGDE